MIATPTLSSNDTPSTQWFSTAFGNAYAWKSSAASPNGVSVHLNFHGEAGVNWKNSPGIHLQAGQVLWLRAHPVAIEAQRLPGPGTHQCLTLFFPDAWLRTVLPPALPELAPDLQAVLFPSASSPAYHMRSLTCADQEWAQPESLQSSMSTLHPLLQTARLTEYLVREVFDKPSPALKLSRSERMARERVERVKAVLMEKLEETPDMPALSTVAGCTASHLSRSFTLVEGITMSLWLRKQRIEKAATLLATGACNVSEAAIAVGYQSLAHFSRSFLSEKGVSPSRYSRHLAQAASGWPEELA